MGERVFIEDWIRGSQSELFRRERKESHFEKHPHVTFCWPGEVKEGHEELFVASVIDFCRGKQPIKYLAGGGDNFGDITYVPVLSPELLEFNNGLEAAISEHIMFEEKPSENKVLHITYDTDVESFNEMEFVMLRLTCIKGEGVNKRIYFSYDFVTQEFLNRDDSLDETRWTKTRELYLASC